MKLSDIKNLYYEFVQGSEDSDYSSFCFDTRKIEPGCLFICVKGLNFDSHDKIEEIVSKGAKGIIIAHECYFPENVDVFYCEDSRQALATVAAAFAGYPAEKMTTIAVTGTKGKTTTVNMIKHLLEKAGKKVGTIGTLGISIGDKLTPTLNTTPDSTDIQAAFKEMVDAGCAYMVMEVSSQAVKMSRIAGIKFDYGIFTNISNDHIGEGEHKDFTEYLICKTKMFDNVKNALINLDEEHSEFIIVNGRYEVLTTYGSTEEAKYKYGNIRYLSDGDCIGLEFDADLDGRKLDVEVGIPGEFNAPNAMAAISVCHKLGISDEILETGLKDIHVNGRMELVYSDNDMKVIVDFAHNAVSTENLLKTLRSYNPKRLVVVFGCGGNRSKDRRYDMGRICGKLADFSIITEDNSRFEDIKDIINDIRQTFDTTGGKCVEVPDRPDAVKYAIMNHEPGDIIAIIGKGHEDYIEKNGERVHYTDREAVETAIKDYKAGK